jgi:phosphonate transport system ATP-binding protein
LRQYQVDPNALVARPVAQSGCQQPVIFGSHSPAMTGLAIRIEAATKTFAGGRRALRAVSTTVQRGERVALLGASGSGKTTLLRCVCGLERLDAGPSAVEVFGDVLQSDGQLARNVRAQRKRIGIVFQQFNLVGRLSVMTNVMTGLMGEMPLTRSLIGRFTTDEKVRVLQALDSVGLAEYALQRASTLSGGQQQRAAVARALVSGAQLLLADEPVASLDPESARRVMALLSALNERHGMTLLISLHQVALARRYCERVIALRDGELIFDGPSAALDDGLAKSSYGALPADADVGTDPAQPEHSTHVPVIAGLQAA